MVATWLAATAKKCGYPSDLLSNLNDSGDITSPSSAVKKPRLKGRARKVRNFRRHYCKKKLYHACPQEYLHILDIDLK